MGVRLLCTEEEGFDYHRIHLRRQRRKVASAYVKMINSGNKGRTGRLTHAKRKRRGLDIKRTKRKHMDGGWDSPAGIARPKSI
jgi:uncharacterized protein with von Willebrand factor type A (vWA) domain